MNFELESFSIACTLIDLVGYGGRCRLFDASGSVAVLWVFSSYRVRTCWIIAVHVGPAAALSVFAALSRRISMCDE